MKDTHLQPGTLAPCSQVQGRRNKPKPPGVRELEHTWAVSALSGSQPPLLTYIRSEEIKYLGSVFFFLRQEIM